MVSFREGGRAEREITLIVELRSLACVFSIGTESIIRIVFGSQVRKGSAKSVLPVSVQKIERCLRTAVELPAAGFGIAFQYPAGGRIKAIIEFCFVVGNAPDQVESQILQGL